MNYFLLSTLIFLNFNAFAARHTFPVEVFSSEISHDIDLSAYAKFVIKVQVKDELKKKATHLCKSLDGHLKALNNIEVTKVSRARSFSFRALGSVNCLISQRGERALILQKRFPYEISNMAAVRLASISDDNLSDVTTCVMATKNRPQGDFVLKMFEELKSVTFQNVDLCHKSVEQKFSDLYVAMLENASNEEKVIFDGIVSTISQIGLEQTKDQMFAIIENYKFQD